MGLLDRFLGRSRGNVITGTRVLVCSLGEIAGPEIEEDEAIYRLFYPNTVMESAGDLDAFLALTRRGYDVIHLFCDLHPEGFIAGSGFDGTNLIAHCHDAGAKLLWIARGNPSSAYIKGFNPQGRAINLVMTLDRRGQRFGRFLHDLLSGMSRGKTMPLAWVALNHQFPNHTNEDEPDTIFSAGYGAVVLKA